MFIKWSPNDRKSLVFVCILRAHNLKREMANVMAEPPESGKRLFNEAQQKRLKPTQQPEENEWKRGPEIIRMLNELPVVYIPSNGRQLPAERK